MEQQNFDEYGHDWTARLVIAGRVFTFPFHFLIPFRLFSSKRNFRSVADVNKKRVRAICMSSHQNPLWDKQRNHYYSRKQCAWLGKPWDEGNMAYPHVDSTRSQQQFSFILFCLWKTGSTTKDFFLVAKHFQAIKHLMESFILLRCFVFWTFPPL